MMNESFLGIFDDDVSDAPPPASRQPSWAGPPSPGVLPASPGLNVQRQPSWADLPEGAVDKSELLAITANVLADAPLGLIDDVTAATYESDPIPPKRVDAGTEGGAAAAAAGQECRR